MCFFKRRARLHFVKYVHGRGPPHSSVSSRCMTGRLMTLPSPWKILRANTRSTESEPEGVPCVRRVGAGAHVFRAVTFSVWSGQVGQIWCLPTGGISSAAPCGPDPRQPRDFFADSLARADGRRRPGGEAVRARRRTVFGLAE